MKMFVVKNRTNSFGRNKTPECNEESQGFAAAAELGPEEQSVAEKIVANDKMLEGIVTKCYFQLFAWYIYKKKLGVRKWVDSFMHIFRLSVIKPAVMATGKLGEM